MTLVPQWWPRNGTIYNINKSWADNIAEGPFMNGMPVPPRNVAPKSEWIDFLGHKVASPLGVPAGPLLGSKWIDLAGRLGFDVLAYKTIRSSEFMGHGAPNMIYVDPVEVQQLIQAGQEMAKPIHQLGYEPQEMDKLAITNSFGMPSKSREYLQSDIPLANSLLKEGQVMIVSVVGTPSNTGNHSEDYTNFVKDFAETAAFAKSCGAKIIEANFSCPNVVTGEGSIYHSVQSVKDIATHIVNSIGDTPFIIKVGTYKEKQLMEDIFKASAQSKVSAICGINSVSMKVENGAKEPALGPNRLVSGICGSPIRTAAVNFIKEGSQLIKQHDLPLTLLGCGGVTEPQHFDEFLNAGAKIAMTATGIIWDPYLALRYHNKN